MLLDQFKAKGRDVGIRVIDQAQQLSHRLMQQPVALVLVQQFGRSAKEPLAIEALPVEVDWKGVYRSAG